MVFYPGEQQRSRVVREEFETYVHLFPFFGLNWTLELGYTVLSNWESCASWQAADFTHATSKGLTSVLWERFSSSIN